MEVKNLFLVSAIVGAVLPYIFFVQHFSIEGIGLSGFVAALFANPAAGGFTVDLLFTSVVFWILMFQEHSRKKGPHPFLFVVLNGLIGLSCALWCRFFGARNVVISEMSPARLEMARKFGFDKFTDPSGDVAAEFATATGAEPDIQFECVGATGLMQQCIERAPKRGIIMGIGVCDNPDTIVPLVAFIKELTVQWAVAYDKEDFEFTIDMMVAGRIDGSPMVTNIVGLTELPEMFEALRSPTDQCKVIIDLTA